MNGGIALGVLLAVTFPTGAEANGVLGLFTTTAIYEALLSNIDGDVEFCDAPRRKIALWSQKRAELERRALAAEGLFPPGEEQKAVKNIRRRYENGEWTSIYESATRISRPCTEADLKMLDDSLGNLATLVKEFESRARQYER